MQTKLALTGLAPQQMIQKFDGFMHKITQFSDMISLNLTNFQADHIALRINEQHLAICAHQEWQKQATVISNAHVNGRPIIVFLLDEALMWGNWYIECLELPYPVEGKYYPEQAWEHIEFVIPSSAQTAEEYLIDLQTRLPNFAEKFRSLSELGVEIKLSSPKAEGERLPNPTIAFKWDHVCIKLHPYSLREIIESERLG
jgi:predicted metalloenzyme YecM